jgi:glycine betaine/proline transport system permease protein
MYRIPIGKYVEKIIDWMKNELDFLFDFISTILLSIIDSIDFVLTVIPYYILIPLVALFAWKIGSKGIAVFTLIGLLLINSMDLWSNMIQTVSLVVTATLIALFIGLPVGIWMSRNNKANNAIRPILDFMQTMPAFVYLIPAVYFFGIGPVPGLFATVIFAMPPVVRLTSLGIRQVAPDVIEASKAFGATSRQLLIKVQIPLAMPTILAGLNQTIMLSLSMVVISAMIGAKGLGEVVLRGINQMEVGTGFEGGLAVVILAMILDRLTQGVKKPKKKKVVSENI